MPFFLYENDAVLIGFADMFRSVFECKSLLNIYFIDQNCIKLYIFNKLHQEIHRQTNGMCKVKAGPIICECYYMLVNKIKLINYQHECIQFEID